MPVALILITIYYFFVFKLSVINELETDVDLSCFLAKRQDGEIKMSITIQAKEEKEQYLTLSSGDTLLCRLNFNDSGGESREFVVVGYFEESIKEVTISINESKGKTVIVVLNELGKKVNLVEV